ncbi:MAG: PAS domain-containing protein [Rhodospirillaceae bacterium]|nr:PAS domain-containing protein [Rhodospirillaceae bacterium]
MPNWIPANDHNALGRSNRATKEMEIALPTSDPLVTSRDIEDFIAHWRAIQKEGLVPGPRAFLDAPPFRLQSEVVIYDVHGPTDIRLRLFGSGLSTIVGRELTGSDMLQHFRPKARAEAGRIVWCAVSKPCGFIRRLEMSRGAVVTSALSVGLPVRQELSGRMGVVAFVSRMDRTVEYTIAQESPFLSGVKLMQWVDIGAGVPEA